MVGVKRGGLIIHRSHKGLKSLPLIRIGRGTSLVEDFDIV